MDVYQCPECELRFRSAAEVEQHLRLDHPDFPIDEIPVESALRDSRRRRQDRGS